jgi:hypothetical protein
MITILPMTDTFGGLPAMPPSPNSAENRIRDLNDQLRCTFASGRVVLTAGVRDLDDTQRTRLLKAVQAYDGFTSGNDPYDEHDFGRVVVAGRGYFWKIDTYDLDYLYHSPDPADETVTARIMTIMREDEY